MKWKIQIDGDKRYIDDLIDVFKALNFEPLIYREGDSIYLECKMFDNITDAKDISSKVKTLLVLLPVAFNFKTERAVEPLRVVAISYEEGDVKSLYDSAGNLLCKAPIGDVVLQIQDMVHSHCIISDSAIGNEAIKITQYNNKGEIIGGINTIEAVKNYIETNSNPESLKNAAQYLKRSLEKLLDFSHKLSGETPTKDIVEAESKYGEDIELAKWTALRKIYESIKEDLGLDFIKNYLGAQLADDFYYTACYYYIHTETGNIKEEYEKPSRKMPLSEAEELISKLLSKYIEEKVNGGVP